MTTVAFDLQMRRCTEMARHVTVVQLAREAEADVEEVLVSLWDAGIEDIEDPDDVVPPPDLKRARYVLGIETGREQRQVKYWLTRTGLSRLELAELLSKLGVTLSPRARTLPKGALSKLRRRYDIRPTDHRVERDPLEPCPQLVWTDVGHRRSPMCYLSEEDLIQIHQALVTDFAAADDPISPPGVKSANLLSSALTRPQTGLGEESKYPTVEMAAGALLHSLVLNHPFHNGNKRTGVVAMLVFLDANGMLARCDESALFRLVLRVAQHGLVPLHCDELADREVLEIAHWVRRNSRPIEKGERPIPWLKLRRILRSFGCESETSPNVGNRINLRRTVQRKGLLGRSRSATLSIQVADGAEGRTVERNTLNAIRRALELDEENGVDSRAFYEADTIPDDFIQQYRTLLRRLSRL
jgi:death-on-curing family protein